MTRTHGEVRQINGKRVASPEYMSWQMMKNRCANPRATDYAYYGARGITFDPRWRHFEAFLEDMGRKPTRQYTLERIDVSKGYSKDNCTWATRRAQARNRQKGFHTCSMERADEIRALYATGRHYQYELAARFGITQAHVSQITRNTCWARD